jgi:hypothetical protein
MYGGWRLGCLLCLSKGEWSCQLCKAADIYSYVALYFRCVLCQLLCWPRTAVLWTWTLRLANTSPPRYCGKSRRSRILPSIHWRRTLADMYICQMQRSTCDLSDCRILRSRVVINMNELAQNAVYSKRRLCASQCTTALFTYTMRTRLGCLLAHKYCST